MRLPLEGLVCVLIAAGCSTEKPPETANSTTMATGDTTVTTEPSGSSELTPASPADAPAEHTMADDTARRRTVDTTAPSTIGDTREASRPSDPPKKEPSTAPDNTKPDNTKINKRDNNSAALTPIDQGENATDLKLTQQIRQAVMADGSLSFTAKNVKIITLNKKVTLRGPVNTAAERASIEAAARKIAGAGMVDNQLEIAP
jgi:hypothetical protein